MERRLDWPSCANVRDLGGHRAGARESKWRAVVRADNLNRLTEGGRASLVAYGVRTVIDLRDPRELERFPYPFGPSDLPNVLVRNVPLISVAEWEAIKDPERMREGYVLTAKLSLPNIVSALNAIAEAPPGAVVVHCHEGRERTGIVVALLLAIAGVDDETIGADWVLSEPETMEPAWIIDVLQHMRRERGSVEQYLAAGGLTAAAVDALRSRLFSS
ncbi:MAG TPA: tyrosine-protein phosphatase [Verrucomicrobiae bacterium]|nr:tyrosine-protein phosphatase [Verrucomicrobiae bacterium]